MSQEYDNKKSSDISNFSRDQQNISVEEYQKIQIEELSKINDNASFVDFGGVGEDSNYYYFGSYVVGTTKWRIQRFEKSDKTISWASGDSNLQQAWNDRTSHEYNLSI